MNENRATETDHQDLLSGRTFSGKGVRLGPRGQAGLIVVIAIAVYANSLLNGFAFDDVLIVQNNPLIQSFQNTWQVFTSGYWQQWSGGLSNYRPFFTLSLMIDTVSWKGNPFGYHLTNVLLHTATCVLLFTLVRKYGLSSRLALHSTLIFAVLPVHTEAVANIAGRMEILGTLFSGLSWLCWKQTPSRRLPGAFWQVLSGLFFLSSILSKENFVTYPVALFAAEWLSRKPLPTFRETLRMVPPFFTFFLGLGLYLLLRKLSGETIGPPAQEFSPLAKFNFGQRCLIMSSVSLDGYRSLVLGSPLKPMYDQGNLSIIPHLTARAGLGLGLFIGLAGFALLAIRRIPLISFAIFLGVSQFFIVSNIPFPIGAVFGERWLYFPSFGFCLLVGYGFYRLERVLLARKVRQSTALVLLLFLSILGGYSLLTVRRNLDWKDNLTLFSRFIQTDPTHPLGYSQVAKIIGERNPALARSLFITGLKMSPGDLGNLSGLASLNFLEDNLGDAEEQINAILAVEPPKLPLPAADWAGLHLLKAAILFQKGNLAGGERELATTIRYYRNAPSDRLFYGTLLLKRGKPEGAVIMLRSVIQTNPEISQSYNNLGVALLRMGRLEEARESFEATLRLDSGHKQAIQNLEAVKKQLSLQPSPPVRPKSPETGTQSSQ